MAYTEAQVRAWFAESGKTIATPGETEAQRLARITRSLNDGSRTEAEVRQAIATSGAYDPNALTQYGGTKTSTATATTSGGGAYTEAQVASWFAAAGQTIATPGETEAQRLARITQSLNSGARTEAEIKSSIGSAGVYDPNAPLMYGGAGSGSLQEITGGNAEVWQDTTSGVWYLAYYVPGTRVPLLYAASPDQLNALFPEGNIRADRSVTTQGIAQMGGIYAGAAEDPFGNPYRAFIEQLEREAEMRPWLNDADMLAIMFEAALEGRTVSTAELMGTRWWQTHNETQRAWLTMIESDPMTAQGLLESAQINTRSLLEQLGMASPPEDIVNWLSNQRITGSWTEERYRQQLRAIADPHSGLAVDPQLRAVIGGRGLDTAMRYEEEVRQDVAKWLGPLYGKWSDSQIAHWAGRIRNDPDAREEMVNLLRGQRQALFPEYANPMLTYEDISAPWRNMWQNEWGQLPDETDPLFQEVLRMNDYAEAGKRLRSEGLARNIGQVTQSLEATGLETGAQVRRLF